MFPETIYLSLFIFLLIYVSNYLGSVGGCLGGNNFASGSEHEGQRKGRKIRWALNTK